MRWLIWLSQHFHLLLLFYSLSTSSSSSSFASTLKPLRSQDQQLALLHFKQLFTFSEFASYDCDLLGYQHSYPKMESWKKGTDYCSWDGITCDRVKGNLIGFDLSCSWLQGTIPPNSTLFLLSHLQYLNLAFNDFDFSLISSGFGQFTRLRYLNLSGCVFSGQVPLRLLRLSLLASLYLSQNHFVSLETFVVRRLAKNLKMLRELHLDLVDMSSVSLRSLMNFSSSLTTLSLFNCELQGTLPVDIFRLPNLLTLTLTSNIELRVFSIGKFDKSLKVQFPHQLGTSRKLLKFSSDLTTSPVKFHHFQS
uniref:Leucine-rich repeat-containing N-terminal plant-type domain-containing protein n=1 Tax=Quercus lobata TaxID=97700 RepID=A0A7N2MAH0_QUELO